MGRRELERDPFSFSGCLSLSPFHFVSLLSSALSLSLFSLEKNSSVIQKSPYCQLLFKVLSSLSYLLVCLSLFLSAKIPSGNPSGCLVLFFGSLFFRTDPYPTFSQAPSIWFSHQQCSHCLLLLRMAQVFYFSHIL